MVDFAPPPPLPNVTSQVTRTAYTIKLRDTNTSMNCVINLFMTLIWVRSLQANASNDACEQYSEKMTNVQQDRCDNLETRSN